MDLLTADSLQLFLSSADTWEADVSQLEIYFFDLNLKW